MALDRSAPGVRLTLLHDERATSGEPLDVDQRLLSLVFEDCEDKADKLTLTLDNADLALFERDALMSGAIVEASWGYPGRMAPPVRAVIQSMKGFSTLTLEGQALSALMNRQTRTRRWERTTHADVVRAVAREHGYEGALATIDDTATVVDVVNQMAETDARFLKRLAAREGFAFFVDRTGLHWHRRKQDAAPTHVSRPRPAGACRRLATRTPPRPQGQACRASSKSSTADFPVAEGSPASGGSLLLSASKQPFRGVVIENLRVPDVAPSDLDVLVERLPHDGIEVLAVLGGRGHEACAQGVPGHGRRIETDALGGTFHRLGDGASLDGAVDDAVALVDGPVHRPFGDLRGREPALEGAHGADGASGRVRDGLLFALGFLVALGATHLEDEAVVVVDDVVEAKRGDLGPSKGAEKADYRRVSATR